MIKNSTGTHSWLRGFPGRAVFVAILAAAMIILMADTSMAQRFRVDSKVFDGKKKTPMMSTVTLFHNGVVYDILDDDQEITVHDTNGKQVILLNPQKQTKTIMSTDQIATFVEGLRLKANMQKNSYYRFLASPDFEVKEAGDDGELVLSSPFVTYEAKLRQYDDTTVKAYRDFADLQCMLNTLINPGSRPPYARMELNKLIARNRSLPLDVHLTLRPSRNPLAKKVQGRSEHVITLGLTDPDLRRIAAIGAQLAEFEKVDFSDYQLDITRD